MWRCRGGLRARRIATDEADAATTARFRVGGKGRRESPIALFEDDRVANTTSADREIPPDLCDVLLYLPAALGGLAEGVCSRQRPEVVEVRNSRKASN